jgi:hypothetical protein
VIWAPLFDTGGLQLTTTWFTTVDVDGAGGYEGPIAQIIATEPVYSLYPTALRD